MPMTTEQKKKLYEGLSKEYPTRAEYIAFLRGEKGQDKKKLFPNFSKTKGTGYTDSSLITNSTNLRKMLLNLGKQCPPIPKKALKAKGPTKKEIELAWMDSLKDLTAKQKETWKDDIDSAVKMYAQRAKKAAAAKKAKEAADKKPAAQKKK